MPRRISQNGPEMILWQSVECHSIPRRISRARSNLAIGGNPSFTSVAPNVLFTNSSAISALKKIVSIDIRARLGIVIVRYHFHRLFWIHIAELAYDSSAFCHSIPRKISRAPSGAFSSLPSLICHSRQYLILSSIMRQMRLA